MEERRLQLTGRATYVISLPKQWVRKRKLQKGSKVLVMETSRGDLLIKTKETKKCKIPVEGGADSELLKRLLISRYIQGYDSVIFVSRSSISPELRRELKDASKLLIGVEVFGDFLNSLEFRVLLHDDELDVKGDVVRMLNLIKTSLQEVVGCLLTGDIECLRSIEEREKEADKLYFLILRQSSFVENPMVWSQIARNLERLADHILLIASLASSSKLEEQVVKPLLDLHSKASELFAELQLIVKRFDAMMADSLIRRIEVLRSWEQEVLESLTALSPKAVLICESFCRIVEYMCNVAEMVINTC